MRWVVLLLLLSGCLSQAAVKEKFVCSDGWVVDSPGECVGHERVCYECPPCPCADDPCAMLGCPFGTEYVASRNSELFHDCTCKWAERISPANIVCYNNSDEAVSDGKKPCETCVD